MEELEREIQQMLEEGLNCAQIVLLKQGREHAWGQKWPTEQLRAITALFGGGMGYGSICGCVTAAYMAIGLACGTDKARARALKKEFDTAFIDEFGSLNCAELLQTQTTDEQQAAQKGSFMNPLCPQIMLQTGMFLGTYGHRT